jgi:hypothetical protein
MRPVSSLIFRPVFILALAFPALAGCASPGKLEPEDRSEIYAAVIRRIYTQDDTFGGSLRPPLLYVLDHSDDSVGDPEAQQSDSQIITKALRRAIELKLEDLPTQLVWIGSMDEIPRDPDTHSIASGGAVLTLGNIHLTDAREVQVSASLYVGMLAAGGQTYIVQHQNGIWVVTGTTGVMWIS